MRIALLHGWELTGSGSNEYNRYLAGALARAGHEVHVLCREPHPDRVDGVRRAIAWSADRRGELLFERPSDLDLTVHQLPHGPVRGVFVTDKQREGNVKAFASMSDAEIEEYLALAEGAMRSVLTAHPVDVLHANHVVPQPTLAHRVCGPLGIPVVIYPHGIAIEYTVRLDPRFERMAGEAIAEARRLIIGSREVQGRLLELYPDQADDIRRKTDIIGVGVDTSLFTPVRRADRIESIETLAAKNPGGGKTPDLVAALHERLDVGDLDAIGSLRDAYARAHPDVDAASRLRQLPWADGRVLLFVGALTVGKGLQSVIAALPQVLAQHPDAHLVVVGSGRYREALEAFVHAIATSNGALLDRIVERGNDLDETHLTGAWPDVQRYLADPEHRSVMLGTGTDFARHVHFVGRMNHDLLQHLFPCADLAVFPSIVPEAYPLVLMESLSNGVLPAASDFSGFREGLDLLVPFLGAETVDSMRLPTDDDTRVAGIADRLVASLGEESDRTDALRRIAVEQYDWTRRAEEMVDGYARAISDAPTSSSVAAGG